MSYIVTDIDGTLTTSGDTPRADLIEFLRSQVKDNGDRLIVLSGRLISRLDETEEWLRDNDVPYDRIYLNDFTDTPGPEVNVAFKAYKLAKLQEELGEDIAYVVDDDAEARSNAEGMGIDAFSPEQLLRLGEGALTETNPRAINPDGYETTDEIRAEAERGLEWRREYGRGGTLVGVARARDLASGKRIPYETVVRIRSYLARHEVDKQAEGFSVGEDGYPSAGRIAWALWGGDAAQRWAESIIKNAAEDTADRSEREIMGIEFRTAAVELRAVGEDGYTFEGYAALYDSPSGEGATPEVIKPGAFARSISASKRGEWDVKAYQDHNPERLLGTTKSGTLSLEDDGKGLKATISLNPNITFHRDLAELVKTMGRSLGMSFGFFSTAANRINDEGVREIRDVKLVEVSALTGLSPYYPGTISTVAVRSLASEAGIEIEPLRAAVEALLAGEITPDQAQILSDAVAAIIADDEADQGEEETAVEEVPVEEAPAEEAAPRAVPRSVREKEIELARRAVK